MRSGTGSVARGLATSGASVTGLDPASELIEEARVLDAEAGVSVDYVVGKVEESGFSDASFDVVTAGQCWHWFDRSTAAAEVFRVLRPGGRVVVAHFDWIEKAHRDVLNRLLQIMEDGRLTDSHGRTVNFRNTVLIMTSNIGSAHLIEGVTDRGEIEDVAREAVFAELHSHFRPEFLNRVDETILFKPLQLEEIKQIVDLMVRDLQARLEERKIELRMADEARELISREGFDPVYGARPLRRFIQREVETRIARALIAGDVREGARVSLGVKDGHLDVDISQPAD